MHLRLFKYLRHILFITLFAFIFILLLNHNFIFSNNVTPVSSSEINSKNNIISKSVLLGYSNSDNLTIFSAFSNPDKIVVIISSYGYLNRRIVCRYFDSKKIEFKQELSVVFPEYTIKCPPHKQANFIGISVNKDDNLEKIIEIQKKSGFPFSNLTVCLAPIFGASPKVLMLIEFLEYYKLQGADRFLIYIYDVNQETEKLLEMYKHWMKNESFQLIRISNNTKCLNRHRCRHEMQLQDCILRSRGNSKFVATVDLDERIMPIDQNVTLINYIRSLGSNPNIGELRFRCQWTLRYKEVDDDDPRIDNLPMLNWHNTSHVAPQNHTTKSVVRPEMVDSMGVHGVQKFNQLKTRVFLVPPDEALTRHYRLTIGWSFFLKEAESFGEFSYFRLESKMEKLMKQNVQEIIRRFMKRKMNRIISSNAGKF